MLDKTVSSSVISKNPSFKELNLPPKNVLIFGNYIVNLNSKINIIEKEICKLKEQELNIFFVRATIKDMLHYIDGTLEDNSSEVEVIYVSVILKISKNN